MIYIKRTLLFSCVFNKGIFIVFIFLSTHFCFAQKQGDNWYFGGHIGVVFNSNGTVSVNTKGATDGNVNIEGTATISDTSGNLLFYTDGQTVWNRNNLQMTNGTGLMGNNSSSQAAVIVPHPTSLDSFYIFTVDDAQHNLNNGLRYSIVRKSLSGGLGAVTATKNILLSPANVKIAEKITAVRHCNNRDIWVIVHGYKNPTNPSDTNGNKFFAYLITKTGINTIPVISTVGTVLQGADNSGYGNARGYMKASSNGSKIANAIPYDGCPNGGNINTWKQGSFEVFDFNYTTGVVSNSIKFTGANYKGAYGIEFSPDGTKLYGATWGQYSDPTYIIQWDLNAGTPSAISSSATLVGQPSTTYNPGALQLAPNHKIYITIDHWYANTSQYLYAINSPNGTGTACNYQANALYLCNSGNSAGSAVYGCRLGLPTFIQSYFDPNFSFTYTNNYINNITQFTLADSTGLDSVQWIFKNPNTGYTTTSKSFNPGTIFNDTGQYNITLIIFRCLASDTIRKFVHVWSLPNVDFIINDTSQCLKGNKFIFTDISLVADGSIDTVIWKFGDGNISYSPYPSHTYSSSGDYNIKLIAISNHGSKDSLVKKIHVLYQPKADFTINDSVQCITNNLYTFHNISSIKSGKISSYFWDLGDSISSIDSIPLPHHYKYIDTFFIKLVAVSDFFCEDTIIKKAYVSFPPHTAFTINDTFQCLKNNVFVFTNQSATSTGTITSYLWIFGDGKTSTSKDNNHTFLVSDTFTTKLIAYSSMGCPDTFQKKIYVLPQAKAGFTINDSIQCTLDNLFIFKNTSTVKWGNLYYKWYLGDGDTTSTKNPVHNYTGYSTVSIKLFTNTSYNCSDSVIKKGYIYPNPLASFSINDTNQCFNLNNFKFTNLSKLSTGTMNYVWDFGDGNITLNINPFHNYTIYDSFYTIKLLAISNIGCKDSMKRNVFLKPTPNSNFLINNPNQCFKNNNIILTNLSSLLSGTLTNTWYFDDGNSSTSRDTSHIYTKPGIFNIKLVSISQLKCSDTFSKIVNIYPMPTTGFFINDTAQCLNVNSFIIINQSTISSGSLQFLWDFGDNQTSNLQDAIHHYKTSGIYNILLTATSNFGCIDSLTKNIIVYSDPHSDFIFKLGCIDDTTYFTDQSSAIPPDSITSWQWDFPNNQTSVTKNPFFVFSNAGSYPVKLIAGSNHNCYDTVTHWVNFHGQPDTPQIIRVTIINSHYVSIDWTKSTKGSPMNYILERSPDSNTFTVIAILGNNINQYSDSNGIDVNKNFYFYRVQTIDSCNHHTPYSLVSKTILLNVSSLNHGRLLNWNKYQGWSQGVDQYQVQLYNDDEQNYMTLISLMDTGITYLDSTTTLNQFQYCYRISANQKSDNVTSESNIVCVPTPLTCFIPTAFTPNKDGINDYFEIKGDFVIGYTLGVYNRWGECVYQSNNINDKWDGTFKGKLLPGGYYYYSVTIYGTKGQINRKEGTLLILR